MIASGIPFSVAVKAVQRFDRDTRTWTKPKKKK
jgi:hypothetical protein